MEIVQVIKNGIAEVPQLFTSEHAGMMRVVELAEEAGMEYDYDELGTYDDFVVARFADAVDAFCRDNMNGIEIKWWGNIEVNGCEE